MKRELLFIMFLCAAFCGASCRQIGLSEDERGEYVLMVDVSGSSRNIYIEDIQGAIDTFYIAATRHDRLSTYNFAKSVACVGDSVATDFYDYCDLRVMLQSLLGMIGSSDSRYVRVFVLSDFHHADSLGSLAVMDAASMRDMQGAFDTVCSGRDVQVCLMVIPPASRYGGYSLNEVHSVIGPGRCTVHPVIDSRETTTFLLEQVAELDALRGITDLPPAKGSLPFTIAACLLMLTGVGLLCFWRRRADGF